MIRTSIYALLGLAAAAQPAIGGSIGFPEGQGLLIDHQPHNSGGLASDTLFQAGATPFWQLTADDFTLGQPSPVQLVVFWAFYQNEALPIGDETIRIRFYDSRPGDMLPGDVLFEQSFLNLPRSWTGETVITSEGGNEYQFQALLNQPFQASANTKYWLEIVQIGDISTRLRWEFGAGNPLNGQAVVNPNFPDWIYTFPTPTSNTAFQLYSVPEPATSTVVIGCYFLRVMRRRTFRRL